MSACALSEPPRPPTLYRPHLTLLPDTLKASNLQASSLKEAHSQTLTSRRRSPGRSSRRPSMWGPCTRRRCTRRSCSPWAGRTSCRLHTRRKCCRRCARGRAQTKGMPRTLSLPLAREFAQHCWTGIHGLVSSWHKGADCNDSCTAFWPVRSTCDRPLASHTAHICHATTKKPGLACARTSRRQSLVHFGPRRCRWVLCKGCDSADGKELVTAHMGLSQSASSLPLCMQCPIGPREA